MRVQKQLNPESSFSLNYSILPPSEIYRPTKHNEGGSTRKLATELKISAQKSTTGVTAATAIPYENIPFVSLLE